MERLRLIRGGPSCNNRARQGVAQLRSARRSGRRGRQFKSDRPDHSACVVELAYTVGLRPAAERIKGSNPFTGTTSRIGVTAARLTLTQEVVVQIHGPVPYAGLIQRQYAGLQNRSLWFESTGPCQNTPTARTAYRAGVTAARLTLTQAVVVQIHDPVPGYSPVVQLVNAPDRLSGDRGFKSRRGCHWPLRLIGKDAGLSSR